MVCDLYDKIYKGTFLGGNLTTAIHNRTKTGGAVIWGGIRDVEQMKKVPDVQVYYRGIDPCLPPKWKECSIKKKFRGVTYDIHYHNVGEIKKILADGKEIEGDLLPMGETGSTVSVDVYL